MNALKHDSRRMAIHMLTEGCGIRTTSRVAGVDRGTVLRHLRKTGDACRAFLDRTMRGLRLEHLELDECWTFCRKKQARLIGNERLDTSIGDQYLYLAIDEKTKLIPCYALGKRNSEVTEAFINDLAGRIVTRCPQLSSDAWAPYVPAIRAHFGDEDCTHGVITKDFENSEQPGRYAPPATGH